MRFCIILLITPFILAAQDAHFSCDNIKLCLCDSISSGISLKCVQDNQTSLLATLSSRSKSLHISCNNYISTKQLSPSIYDDLSDLKLLSSVRDLHFQFCPLPSESFRSFASQLSMLRVNKIKFEFSSNLIGILSPPYFDNLPYLEELVVSENSNLTGLHIDLFQGTPHLKSLFLRGNALTELYPGVFQHVTKLEVLDLGGNEIVHLDSGVFRNLQSLRILNLDNNKLVNLTRALFNSIPHLESLDISGNRISSLPPGVFADLWELRTFAANTNIFKTFPNDLFSNMKQLEVVKIAYHNYTLMALPSRLFSDLPELKNVTLRESKLRSVPADLFKDSPKLQMISFTGHKRITSLPRNLFKDCKALVKLELSDNMLDDLPDELFGSLGNLYDLNLSKNTFHKIKKVMFDGVTRLSRLDMSHNSLKHIDPYSLDTLPQLSYLDLSHNLLDLGNSSQYSPMKSCYKLEDLLLGDNRIDRIYTDWITLLPKLKYLDLRRNAFTTVTLGAITQDSLLLDLSHNSISIVRLDISHLVTEPRDKVPRVLLNSNPLACNCSNYALIGYVNVMLDASVYNSLQPVTDRITCASTGDLFNKIVPAQVSCLVPNCPTGCYCTFSPYFGQITVNCSSANLSQMPRSLPTSYDGKNATRIQLILSNNSIEQLPEQLHASYGLVRDLDVANNSISYVEEYSYLRDLEKLDLSSNQLEDLNASFVSFLTTSTKLVHIGLNNNPWSCGCNITALHEALQNSPERFTNLDRLSCKSWTIPLHTVNIQEICPSYLRTLVSAGLTLVLVALLLALLVVLYHRYVDPGWLSARGILPSDALAGKKPVDHSGKAVADKIQMSGSDGGKEESCILLPD